MLETNYKGHQHQNQQLQTSMPLHTDEHTGRSKEIIRDPGNCIRLAVISGHEARHGLLGY